MSELRRTPLYEEHKSLGARLVPFAGWEMPVQYAGIVREHEAVRTRAGLFDVSHMGRLFLTGEHAASVVDYLVTGNVARLSAGQAKYTLSCNEQGGILDDLIVYRLEPQRFLVICNAGNREKIVAHFSNAASEHCEFEDASDKSALMALQGPNALRLLGTLGMSDQMLLSPAFRVQREWIGGVECTAARTGYTGEDGYELMCSADDAPALWRLLLERGRELDVLPAGLGARDTLRLEACLPLYGSEIDETTHPYEAQLGWVVSSDQREFFGANALRRFKQEPLSRKLVGFEMTDRGIARHGYPILDPSGETVGVVTSGSPGLTVGKNIGLGYVPISMSQRGTSISVEIRGKRSNAIVVPTPFYKRKK